MIRRPPRSTLDRSSAASDVYKRQEYAVLFATTPGASYLWNDSSTADSLLINAEGVYSVEVFNTCFSFTDTVNITLNTNPPMVDIPASLILCQGQNTILDAAISGVTYL